MNWGMAGKKARTGTRIGTRIDSQSSHTDARTRRRSQGGTTPLTPSGFMIPEPLALINIPTPRAALQSHRQAVRRMEADMAMYVSQLSLLDLFGETFTRAQRWAIRDALRTVYLPILKNN